MYDAGPRILDTEWDNAEELKTAFPTNSEAIFMTNGKDYIRVDEAVQTIGKGSTGSSTASDKDVILATLELKSRNPYADVYFVHNHPTAETIVNAGLADPFTAKSYKEYFAQGHTYEDAIREQRIAGSVPSEGDLRAFYAARNWYNEAIYHQDSNNIVEWQRNSALKTLTRVAVAPRMYYTPFGNPEYSGIDDIYLTDENEVIPGVQYYEPAEYRKMVEEHPHIDYTAALNEIRY